MSMLINQPFSAFFIINDGTVSGFKTLPLLNLSSSVSSVLSAPKNSRLFSLDEDYVKKLYGYLNENSVWKLSSGVVVEEKKKGFVVACNFG